MSLWKYAYILNKECKTVGFNTSPWLCKERFTSSVIIYYTAEGTLFYATSCFIAT
jgi:hypothetical protein